MEIQSQPDGCTEDSSRAREEYDATTSLS